MPALFAAVLIGVAVLAGCGGDESRPAPSAAGPERSSSPATGRVRRPRARFALQRVGRFHRPLLVTQAPGDRARLLVVEKGGRVIVVRRGRQLRRPFLSVRNRVSDGRERGLLGLAFPADHRRTRLLYAAYTDPKGDLRVTEFRRAKHDRDTVDRSHHRLVLRVRHPRPTHNGGGLAFGPDGYLYVGVGDGGGAGDPKRRGQSRATLLGKLLRIDPRGNRKRRYRIPRGNPFRRVRGARPEIYAYGLRNPWRFSFDRRTKALLVSDVGQERWEEINYRPRGRLRGANFGWSVYEGWRRYRAGARLNGRHVAPIHVYGRRQGCSITGGFVVRDRRVPALHGRYLYGDFCTGEIRSLKPRAPRARSIRAENIRVPLLSSFGEDRAGRIYVTSLAGPVYRLRPRRK